jgi:hypothetical protein
MSKVLPPRFFFGAPSSRFRERSVLMMPPKPFKASYLEVKSGDNVLTLATGQVFDWTLGVINACSPNGCS